MDRNVKCKCKSKSEQVKNRTTNKGDQNPNALPVPHNTQFHINAGIHSNGTNGKCHGHIHRKSLGHTAIDTFICLVINNQGVYKGENFGIINIGNYPYLMCSECLGNRCFQWVFYLINN